jgi:signal transduction histidine kinase
MRAPRRSRSTLIVLLLVATLAMTAWLAYEAQHAARSHRHTAENVLRDYASFATWELTRVGRQQMLADVQQQLQRVQKAIERGGLESAVASAGCRACGGGAHQIRSAFSAALPEAQFTFAGEPAAPQVRQLLATSIAGAMRAPKDFTCPELQVLIVDGRPLVVVWRPVHDGRDTPVAVNGFTADVTFVTHVFEQVLKQHALLPPTLVQTPSSPNASLAVRVADRDGHQLFASAPEWSAYGATQQFQKDMGALRVSVALKQDAAARLIIGGLPRQRLPLIVGLLTLTASLVVIALVQLRREAELSRLRSDFVSGVSHELRTPLAQIRMFTETLLLGRVRSEGEGRRSLEIIGRETQRLAQLVENVLLFARGERRDPEIRRNPARLAAIVEEVVESFAPLAAARQARILTQLDQQICASVDSAAIRQILLNLLDNAVKYGPAGQTISVVLKGDARSVQMMVEDEGPGIPAADAERIFEPFNRLARPGDATGGTGIGLAIVQQLVALHHGRVSVEPAARGARFIVVIDGAWSEAAAPAVA